MSWHPGFFCGSFCRLRQLTQLIEVRVDAVDPGDRAQEAGLEESGPLVHQTPVASHVVLKMQNEQKEAQSRKYLH